MQKTGFFTHPECWKHEMGPGHPECPQRLDAIEDRLLMSGVMDALERIEAPLATQEQMERAHSPAYLAQLQAMSAQAAEQKRAGGSPYVAVDPDTCMNEHTWSASMRAAGAAIAATDAVLHGKLENAFCSVRPPGHHAEHAKAMGFCFVNNVAVAVHHALSHHRLKRVAVIDFDVHHGNGTENILAGDPRVLMVGFFQHPFFPFSGDENPAPNMLNLPVAAYTKGMDLREMIEMIWIPRLEAFAPELIVVSAGFDGHREDDMAQMGMNDNDFIWIATRIKEIARRYAKGRIVSCLEGGYAFDALARCVEGHVRVLADL